MTRTHRVDIAVPITCIAVIQRTRTAVETLDSGKEVLRLANRDRA
jgi:hypothetical protein